MPLLIFAPPTNNQKKCAILASQIGQKQYELINHLGNVQATVSDLPYLASYTEPGNELVLWHKEPALPAAYDSFGMLMPGRYTSDTNSRCLLVSRSTWATTMVDSCYPAVQLTGTATTLGVATYNSPGGGTFAAAAPRATDGVVLNQTVASGIDNVLTFDVVDIKDGDEEGVLVTVLETIDNVPYVIGGGRLRQGRDQRISFKSTGNNIQVVLNGPYTNLILAQICTRYARSTAQTYLVEVRDESKDRYRFGFNGQEKVNEIAGIGNHYTAEFWEYDSRVARRWNLDPIDQVSISNYAVLANNPILRIDPNGAKEFESYKSYKKELGADAIAQKDWTGQDGHWLKSDREFSRDRWSFANHNNLQKSDGYKEYKTIEQRTMFYGWYSLVEASRGGETKWAGAAYLVALNMSLLERVVKDPVVANVLGTNTSKDMLDFANAGNEAIFNDVFPKLADNRFAPPKKGLAASNWDDNILYNEQFNVVDPIYKQYQKKNPQVIKYLQIFSSEGGYLQMPKPLIFKGNLMNPQDRFNYGKFQVTPFYINLLKNSGFKGR